jgi:predicted ATPase
MITKLHIHNFKGHSETALALPRFAVLVGDNGSGKTSVLEALRLPAQLVPPIPDTLRDGLLRRGARTLALTIENGRETAHLKFEKDLPSPPHWTIEAKGTDHDGDFRGNWNPHTPSFQEAIARVQRITGEVALYRFRAEKIAASAFGRRVQSQVQEDGQQTAVVLAELKLADDERFQRIEASLKQIVPTLRRIRIRSAMLEAPDTGQSLRGNRLYFDFVGAQDVPAEHASQGTLIALALLTVLHAVHPPRVILLDELDHSLHPRAQMALVRMLQALLDQPGFHDRQIVTTTHSPYVLDEVEPASVIAFALRDDGTVAAKPLTQHPDAGKASRALKAGELWSLDAERDWVR